MKNTTITLLGAAALASTANGQTFDAWNFNGTTGTLSNGATVSSVDNASSQFITATDANWLSTYVTPTFKGIRILPGNTADITIVGGEASSLLRLAVFDLDNSETSAFTLTGAQFSAPIDFNPSILGGVGGQPGIWNGATQTLTGLSAPSGANPEFAADVFDLTGINNFTISNNGADGSGGFWVVYSTVPEPSSVLLLGLSGLGLLARRKRS